MTSAEDDNSRPAATTGSRPTTDTLRDAIDHGETADKVDHSDPAAAPLGTDAEAGGAPATPAQVGTALRHEAGRPDDASGARVEERSGIPGEGAGSSAGASAGGSRPVIWIGAACVALLIVAALFLA